MGHLGFALARLDRETEARALLPQITSDFDRGVIQLGLNEQDAGWQSIERAARAYSPSVLWIGVDYRFERFRGTPRYKALMDSIGLGR